MNLKSLLFAAGLCIGAGASAQVGTGKMRQMSLEIKPRLHAVKHAPQWLDRPLRAADVRKAAGEKAVNEPAKALPARAGSSAGGKQKLDSIVTINPDGSYGSLQCYEYDSDGRETKSTNSYWDAAAGTWGEPVVQYDYVWTDDGLLLSEQSMIYDMGSRVEYKYNGQGLKTEQINYHTDYDGNWVAESKGEYDYDDAGNLIEETYYSWNADKHLTGYTRDGMRQVNRQTDAEGGWVAESKGEYDYDDAGNLIEETLYSWDGSQWQPDTRNCTSWDAKKRQTGYTGYAWDGTQWAGTEKYDCVWYDGPSDPETQYQEDADTRRMTYSGDYFWVDGRWQLYHVFTNDIAGDGRLMGQSDNYYDRRSGTWCGGDDWDGRLNACSTLNIRRTFNERGHHVLVETWKCLPDSAGWVLLGSNPTEWTYDEEGNREGLTKYVNYVYDDEYNKTGETCTEQTWYGYNADNYLTWILEQYMGESGDMEGLYEEKYGYDDNNKIIYTYEWDWVDGVRRPLSCVLNTYDTDGNLTEIVLMIGDRAGMRSQGSPLRSAALNPEDKEGWVNSVRETREYVNDVLVANHNYRWADGEWATNYGSVTEYDFDVPSADLCLPDDWEEPYKVNRTYSLNADGNNGWSVFTANYFYSDNTATGIGGATATGETGIGIRLSGDMLTITAGGDVSVSIYSVGGACVKTSSEKSVYVGDMPAGIYIVAVNGYKTKIVKS